MTQYDGIVADIAGTFEFTIYCPKLVTGSTLDDPIEALSYYDLASNATVPINLEFPNVTVTPPQCFEIATFAVTDPETGLQPDYISITEGNIVLLVEDRSLLTLGEKTLNIVAIVDNDAAEQVQEHAFKILFYDSCNQTALIETSEMDTIITINALASDQNITESFSAFKDIVGRDYGV